ncbi:AB-hydrolase YheT [Dentipellis sp. KUC8613]|nr:AB-hydrolase YheT [Dentipellis sp. KUC8613]
MGSVLSFGVLMFVAQTPRTYFTASPASLSCPSLFAKFRSAWWLTGGHLQTLYSVVGDFSKVDQVVYDRKLLKLKDGGTLGLDFTPPASERSVDDDTPIVVVLHGLSGGSHESYVRAILAPAITPVNEGGLGYRAVVVNFRGCAGVPLTSPQLYSAGHTDDIRQAVWYISHLYPKAPLLGVGFSLGANVLARYLAQEGENSRLVAGCVLGCPWNLVKNSEALESGWLSRHVYSRGMASNLKRLISRHVSAISQFPDSSLGQQTPKVLSTKSMTLVDFDNAITRVAGGSSPPFPFPSAWDYYKWASSDQLLAKVRVPLLSINADDDPIVNEVPVDAADNGWVVMVMTRGGGHLGWFELRDSARHPRRWVSKPVIEWLKACGENLYVDTEKAVPFRDADGWLVGAGNEHLGCREAGSGGMVEGAESEEGMLAGL